MARKVIKRVWAGDVYEVEVGNTPYQVKARSVSEILELEEHIRDLVGGEWLTAGEGTEPEEEENAEAQKEESEEQQPILDWPTIKHRIVQVGFAPLKVAIPELTLEDFQDAPLPQLEWVFNIVLEVNGLSLLRSWAKNLLDPLGGAMGRALLGVLSDYLQTRVAASTGETPTTE